MSIPMSGIEPQGTYFFLHTYFFVFSIAFLHFITGGLGSKEEGGGGR